MKSKELITQILQNKTRRIVILVVIVILLGTVLFNHNKKEEIDNNYLMAKIQKSSELTTAKLEYKGFIKFKDDGITIINRADFLMVYKANARAGIDVKEVKIDTDKLTKTIWITIPKATILEVNVDSSEIDYYDEKFTIFNIDEKEDSDRAQAKAEKEAEKEIAKMGILKMADEQAETLLKGLLHDSIPEGYTLKVKKH